MRWLRRLRLTAHGVLRRLPRRDVRNLISDSFFSSPNCVAFPVRTAHRVTRLSALGNAGQNHGKWLTRPVDGRGPANGAHETLQTPAMAASLTRVWFATTPV